MAANPLFKVVLYAPEIPGNTGSIGRTCVALNLELILIHPLGFDISEKAVRRAGLDYWKHVQLKEYQSWAEFLEKEKPAREDVILFEKGNGKMWHEAPYRKGCYLVMGGETRGFPTDLEKAWEDQFYSFPMYSEHVRSLNMSNIATAAIFECLRQID